LKITIIGLNPNLLPSIFNYGFPSNYFYEALGDFGYKFTLNCDSEFLIAINHNRHNYRKFIANSKKTSSACVLIRTEPVSVFPSQYLSHVEKLYGLIISPGNVEVSDLFHLGYEFQGSDGGPKFQSHNTVETIQKNMSTGIFSLENWKMRPFEIVLFGSDKFSPLLKSGYSLRRDLVKVADTKELLVFGYNWDADFFKRMSLYLRMTFFHLRNFYFSNLDVSQLRSINSPNIMGESFEKAKTLESSKFTLVIENSLSTFTEKLFDAMIMGSIPIYVGPNLNRFGIPESTYISAPPDVSEIRQIFKQIKDIDHSKYLDEIRKFIGSELFAHTWCDKAPYEVIAQKIHEYFSQCLAK